MRKIEMRKKSQKNWEKWENVGKQQKIDREKMENCQ
jgi:hypothetical protein